MDMSKWRC